MAAPVDVLAVLDAQVSSARYLYLDQLSKYGHIAGLADDLAKIKAPLDAAVEARAAVAELIEAAIDAGRVIQATCLNDEKFIDRLNAAISRIKEPR